MMRPEHAPFAPLLVDDRSGIVSALIDRRHAIGWTCEDLDDRAGFQERYSNKMESALTPSGRLGFHFSWPTDFLPCGTIRPAGLAAVWLQALGLRLVLVDAATAEAIGATPAPPAAAARASWTGGNAGPGHARRRKARGITPIMSAPAYEALDRTLVAKEAFRSAVIDHPFIDADEGLKRDAEEIERRMAALYQRIGQGE